jgi:hypothetical protein
MNILILASDLEMNICCHSDKHIISNILGTLRVISDSIHILNSDDIELDWLISWNKDVPLDDRYLLGNIHNSTDPIVNWIVNEEDVNKQLCNLAIACCYYLALVDEYVYRFEKNPSLGVFYYKIELLLTYIQEECPYLTHSMDRDDLFTNALYSTKLCKLTNGFETGNLVRDYQALLRRHKREFSQFTKRPIPNFYQRDVYDTFQ